MWRWQYRSMSWSASESTWPSAVGRFTTFLHGSPLFVVPLHVTEPLIEPGEDCLRPRPFVGNEGTASLFGDGDFGGVAGDEAVGRVLPGGGACTLWTSESEWGRGGVPGGRRKAGGEGRSGCPPCTLSQHGVLSCFCN